MYQEVDVTALRKETETGKNKGTGKATKPDTAKATPTPTTTTSSAWGLQTVTAGPLVMMGGAVGAGVLALAVL